MLVHVTDSSFFGMNVDAIDYFYWDFFTPYAMPGIVNTPLAQINVRPGMVLDVSQLRFYIVGPDAANAGLLYRDEWIKFLPAGGTQSYFSVLVNGRSPFDATSTYVGVPNVPMPGFTWLNRNIFDMWGRSAPMHLLVPESQQLQVLATLRNMPFFGPFLPYVGCEICGRWLPKQVWQRIRERG